jgi:hypothetical protein
MKKSFSVITVATIITIKKNTRKLLLVFKRAEKDLESTEYDFFKIWYMVTYLMYILILTN